MARSKSWKFSLGTLSEECCGILNDHTVQELGLTCSPTAVVLKLDPGGPLCMLVFVPTAIAIKKQLIWLN